MKGADEIARRRGTTVTVSGLFGNVPARAAFLRSAAAETRAASDALTVLALCNLPVAFGLRSNDRELLALAPAGLRERVADVWGEAEADSMLDVDGSNGESRLAGLIQRPDAARTGRRRFLFVNGRPFRDRGLGRLVDEAYRTTLAPGLRPDFLLYVSVPQDAVDVNVHPSKTEVRFRDRAGVERALMEAVRVRLGRISSAPELGREPSRGAATGPREPAVHEATGRGQFALFVTDAEAGAETEEEAWGGGTVPPTAPVRPELTQLHNTYILAATRRGLLIIDQHSAHERVLFEELMGRFRESGGHAQRLLFPLTLRLSPSEYSAVEELAPLLSRVGFEVEPFGDRTVIVRSSPNPHAYFDAERCFSEMIHELAEGSPLVDAAGNQHERIAKSLACKGAIKAGQPLSQEEMADLFDRLFATELPGHDVHGRPTVVRLTLEELGRRFGRT